MNFHIPSNRNSVRKLLLAPFAALAVSSVFLVGGCSKKEEPKPGPVSFEAMRAKAEEERIASFAKKKFGDKSTAAESYTEVTSAAQLAYAYYATQKEPDFNQIASVLSPEFVQERDEFKKLDIVNSLKPLVMEGLAKAKQNKYYKISFGSQMDIGPYDVNSKSFRVGLSALANVGGSVYMAGGEQFNIVFVNGPNFSTLVVQDEQKARLIEQRRASGQPMKIWIYYCAGDPIEGRQGLNVEVMRIRLVDEAGNVLAEKV